MVYLYGEQKIADISLKINEEIPRKTEKNYFEMLIGNFAKSLKM